jgi:translation initiation factor IF-3
LFIWRIRIAQDRAQRINGEITAPEIRLVGEDGEQLGIVPIAEALAKAEAAELDLVEIAPTAKPPVCRIMDFGKFKYREAKKQHEARLKLKQIQVKEVKFRPGTDEGDYQIKLQEPDPVPRRRRQGEDHASLPWPRDGASGVRNSIAGANPQRSRAAQRGRVVAELEGRQMVMLLAPKKVAPKGRRRLRSPTQVRKSLRRRAPRWAANKGRSHAQDEDEEQREKALPRPRQR